MTKIKICGLSRKEEIDAANELQPDYVGFVFARKSSRYVSPETAAAFRMRLLPAIPAVGVFVKEPIENVVALLSSGIIQIAQLHGGEDDCYLNTLRADTKAPLIQAFQVRNRQDLEQAALSKADFILLDHGCGGTGQSFDWSLVKDFKGRPFFLAGGLTPENVGQAIRQCDPYTVDVSSGVETDGKKDKEKMRKFIQAVRSE